MSQPKGQDTGMDRALDRLKTELFSPGMRAPLAEDGWRDFVGSCVVVLTAGGEGSRLKSVTEASGRHKTALRLPSGDTMIERTIKMYRSAGFVDFVALVFHQNESIVEVLGDGTDLDVRMAYSHDPGRPVGRGGAIRNALDNGSIPAGKSLIVHNPDDQIVGYDGDFVRQMIEAHCSGLEAGAVATAVVVEGTPYPYTAMKVEAGKVAQIEMYPVVPLPTHTGITVFAPQVARHFTELFDLTKKTDFERTLFPFLAAKDQLYTFAIPSSCWIAVNDPKAWGELIHRLRAG